ncbi:MAG: transcription-repair coupling factor [Blastocatellia bacterium]|nr:transcription-repair coupling factor [Blastocatellia bacterium]
MNEQRSHLAMSMTPIGQSLCETEPFRKLLQALSAHQTVSVSGLLAGGAKALVVATLAAATQRTIAYVSPESELDSFADEVQFFYNLIGAQSPAAENRQSATVVIPTFDVDPYRGVSPHAGVLTSRAYALHRLARNDAAMAVIPLRSLLTRTVPPQFIKQLGCELIVGGEFDFAALVAHLRRLGYRQEDVVTEVGEFSVRGGILDMFTPAHERPLRVEFFGDVVESIREFDPSTQRSVAQLSRAVLAPISEILSEPSTWYAWAEAATARWTDPIFRQDLTAKCAAAEAGQAFQGWEFLAPLVQPLTSTLFDYLTDALFVYDEPMLLQAETEKWHEQMQALYDEAVVSGQLALEPEQFFLTPQEAWSRIREQLCISLSSLDADVGRRSRAWDYETSRPPSPGADWSWTEAAQEIIMSASPMPRLHGQLARLVQQIRNAQQAEMAVWIVARSSGMAERLAQMLRDYQIEAEVGYPGREAGVEALAASGLTCPQVLVGKLTKGFQVSWARLSIFSERDIFQEDESEAVAAPAPGRAKLSVFLSDLRDLKPGDYVVHVDHGIGQFQGLVQLDRHDPREFLLLHYADSAKLYVPVERLDLVQKYSSPDTTAPALDRLGTAAWQRTKARARRALRDMADELLKLYAERQLVQGIAFSADTPWQQEFEDGFEFELTPDQQTALDEIKQDMEQPTPMDRLLCGDVGFGKTEVAMRAAFKAVMDNRQVAVLAPTTLLASQHLRTFQQRFAPFPVNIEMLSRLRSRKEQQRILAGLAEGRIDVIIGTHRLLSKDIVFRDLGLVIVDEEQRFGVAHKERLKQLRRRVDVLTLSATPIPRTLSMSLMGLKPMSVIETPPRDRLSIQTIFAPFSQAIIKTAIERELDRDGQIFFIHNRVDSIHAMAEMIRQLVPHARLGVIHAQMSARQLELTMMKFIQHELDVLVSTTVIENGIDIPRANTIIINHADRFGLAELYQLRGRVGRSNRRAYAYLLVQSERALTPIARRRLAAIKEFSDLGAGFRLAAMDLELRGAGNLLGAEQSGHLRAVGFELYCQMLEQAVRELRGEQIEEPVNTQIDLQVDIRIPQEYVPEMGQRLRLYKHVASATDERRLQELAEEMLDRYGPLPESVQNLLEYARLRRHAVAMRVLAISKQRGIVYIKFDPQARINIENVFQFVQQHEAQQARFSPTGVLSFQPLASGGRDLLLELKTCLMNFQ